jgi:TolB-like protein
MDMKSLRKYAAVILAAGLVGATAYAAAAKPTVAVLHFETVGCKPYLSAVTARYLMTAIAYMGQYDVIAPEKVEKAMEGSGVAEGNALSAADALKTGKQLGAAVVCRGKVAKEGDSYVVTVDFISTVTGGVLTTKSAKVTGEANISKAIDTIVGLTS